MNEQFNENFKNLVTKAKGLLVHFSLNKNQPISTINEYMVQLNMLLNKNTEVILGIENIDIDENMLKYKIIITGL